jgi:uncharacterized membrane protein
MNDEMGNSCKTPGSIEGRVLDERGKPVVEAVVFIVSSPKSHKDIGALTGERGEYHFDDLSPGKYKVQVTAEGFDLKDEEVDVESGERARLDFALKS